MSVTAIIQARMTSTRLPGKVLKEVMCKPMLAYQVERLGWARTIDQVAIATTTNATDAPVAALGESLGLKVFRGSEDDVLQRMTAAARSVGAQIVVRLTADCPILDPEIVDLVVERLRHPDDPVDFVTSAIPRSWPIGLDAEAMTFDALALAEAEAVDIYDREHVTPYIYAHPDRFRIANVLSPEPLHHHRWTLDEAADLDLLTRILDGLYPIKPRFGLRDVLDFLAAHQELSHVNTRVDQKTRRYEDIALQGMRALPSQERQGARL